MAHWDTLDSGTSNAVLSFTSNDNSGPAVGERKMAFLTFSFKFTEAFIITIINIIEPLS